MPITYPVFRAELHDMPRKLQDGRYPGPVPNLQDLPVDAELAQEMLPCMHKFCRDYLVQLVRKNGMEGKACSTASVLTPRSLHPGCMATASSRW